MTRLGVDIELWTVGADRKGLWWLNSDGPWRFGPLEVDGKPHRVHRAVQDHLRFRGELNLVRLQHSTSWGDGTTAITLVYGAVLGGLGAPDGDYYDADPSRHEFMPDLWPAAVPISAARLKESGPAPWHGATQPADDYRSIDVLKHLLRHIKHLLETDSSAYAALDDHWRFHMSDPDIKTALFEAYQHQGVR